jgi:hypothetical protein
VLTEPTDPPRPRQRASTLETRRAALVSWIAEDIPTTRILELARQDPGAPYTGGASTFYRFVAKLRAETEAGAAPVIRFEGLPGEYVQWDWGEARVRLGGAMIKRVFLAGRLKYSRVSAIPLADADGSRDAPAGDARDRRGLGRGPVGLGLRQHETGDAPAATPRGRRGGIPPSGVSPPRSGFIRSSAIPGRRSRRAAWRIS